MLVHSEFAEQLCVGLRHSSISLQFVPGDEASLTSTKVDGHSQEKLPTRFVHLACSEHVFRVKLSHSLTSVTVAVMFVLLLAARIALERNSWISFPVISVRDTSTSSLVLASDTEGKLKAATTTATKNQFISKIHSSKAFPVSVRLDLFRRRVRF